jgi:FHA domain
MTIARLPRRHVRFVLRSIASRPPTHPPPNLIACRIRFHPFALLGRPEAFVPARLICLNACFPGKSIDLANTPLTIGRHPDANLCLPHYMVSRFHCQLAETSGAITMRDLGSRNGILVNGEPALEATLHPGDTLTIGPFTFRLELPTQSSVARFLGKLPCLPNRFKFC